MDNVHGAHCAAGVIEHPFLLLVHVVARDGVVQLADDEVDDAAGVVAVGGDGALRDLVQLAGVVDVELVEARVEEAVQRGEQRQEGGEQTEGAHGEAAAAGLGGLLLFAGGG